jgi:hypothetical protein
MIWFYHVICKVSQNSWSSLLNLISNMFSLSSVLYWFINQSNTGIAYRSDHSPVYLTFQFTEYESGKGTWKFNNRLLLDEEYIKIVALALIIIPLTFSSLIFFNSDSNLEMSSSCVPPFWYKIVSFDSSSNSIFSLSFFLKVEYDMVLPRNLKETLHRKHYSKINFGG